MPLRTEADDLLKCERIEKWCLLKLTCRKGFLKNSHRSKFQSVKRTLVKQSFTNYLGLFHSPIYKYGRNGTKRKWALFKQLKKFKQFKKLISFEKIIILILKHDFKNI